MKYIKGSITNALDAIAEAKKQLDQNTLVVITKQSGKGNPIYVVYATQGELESGQIRES